MHHLVQPSGEIAQSRGDVDMLGADASAGSTADAGGGQLIGGHGVHLHAHSEARVKAHIVIGAEQHGDIKLLGAALTAVAAAGAGHRVLHALGDIEHGLPLQLGQRLGDSEGLQVLAHLLQAGHAAEDDLDLGQPLHPAEGPRGGRLRWTQSPQLGLSIGAQLGQLTAAQRLHDPHGQMVFVEQPAFGLSFLQGPVQIVELNLAEFHLGAELAEETAQVIDTAVRGEAQMPDASPTALLFEVINDPPAGILIRGQGQLADVVEQIKIEVLHPTLPQLLLEESGRIVRGGQLVAGILGGQKEAVPGIAAQHLAHNPLRQAPVIGIGGVEVIEAILQGQGHHLGHLLLVYSATIEQGQAHGPEAQLRDLQIMEVGVNHTRPSSPFRMSASDISAEAGYRALAKACTSASLASDLFSSP